MGRAGEPSRGRPEVVSELAAAHHRAILQTVLQSPGGTEVPCKHPGLLQPHLPLPSAQCASLSLLAHHPPWWPGLVLQGPTS